MTRPFAIGDYRIIVAEQGDVDAVVNLRDAAARWLIGQGIDQWREGQLPRSVVERRADAGSCFLVIGDDRSAPLATLTIDFADPETWGDRGDDGRAGYLHTIVVDPRLIGHGLGVEVVRWGEGFIADSGRRVARLDCAASNQRLVDWYRAIGYRVVGDKDYGGRWFSVRLLERALDGDCSAGG